MEISSHVAKFQTYDHYGIACLLERQGRHQGFAGKIGGSLCVAYIQACVNVQNSYVELNQSNFSELLFHFRLNL